MTDAFVLDSSSRCKPRQADRPSCSVPRVTAHTHPILQKRECEEKTRAQSVWQRVFAVRCRFNRTRMVGACLRSLHPKRVILRCMWAPFRGPGLPARTSVGKCILARPDGTLGPPHFLWRATGHPISPVANPCCNRDCKRMVFSSGLWGSDCDGAPGQAGNPARRKGASQRRLGVIALQVLLGFVVS
jgi:hypothetical protein